MKLIAAAFGNEIDYRSLRLTVLSAEAVPLYAKLLNRVDRGKDQQGRVRTHVHVIDTVNRPQVSV